MTRQRGGPAPLRVPGGSASTIWPVNAKCSSVHVRIVREPGAERAADDVAGLPDEQREVADARVARDVLEHLRVEVGGQRGLALAVLRERQPADEVGQPRERCRLVLRVLVQEVVELPRLVPDPEVVRLRADDVAEDEVVVREHLVHRADHLERPELVLAAPRVDDADLREEAVARGVHALAGGLERATGRLLGEPVDLEAGHARPQLACDREVAARVAQPDRGGDEECAAGARDRRRGAAASRRGRRGDAIGEGADAVGDERRLPRRRAVARALEELERPARQLGRALALAPGNDPVVGAVEDRDRAADPAQLRHGVGEPGRILGQLERRRADLPPPADAVLDLLGAVGLAEHPAEEERQERVVLRAPRVAAEEPPALDLVGDRVEVGRGRPVELQRRADHAEPEHALGMARGEHRAPAGAGREPHHDRLLHAGGVEHGGRVGREQVVGVVGGAGRLARAARAAPVERDDAVVLREVRRDQLPDAGRGDRPRGEQEDRRRSLAPGFPGDGDAASAIERRAHGRADPLRR